MKPLPQRGFTLVELAIVTLIIGMLLSGILISITASQDQRNSEDTQKLMVQAVDAIYGFAAVKGRLPCPATDTTGGQEGFCLTDSDCTPPARTELTNPGVSAHGRCFAPYDGFVPAATLGISPTDGQGAAIDAWTYRIRYAVTEQNTYAFTRAPAVQAIWRDPAQGPTALTPDLQVCSTATGITGAGTATATCPAANQLTASAVAVVLSIGKNGGAAPADADETANVVGDKVFVSHNPTPTFNDQVLWISPNVLYNRMIAAGRLP